MATYMIGDVQGCFKTLQALLEKIQFDETRDTLWFAGDLVNRGPDSLGVLRFIASLRCPYQVVLGNHDIHLLAVYENIRTSGKNDTLEEVLTAPDAKMLMNWLRQKSLVHIDEEKKAIMVHAGVAPHWHLKDLQVNAVMAEEALRSLHYRDALKKIFADRDSDLKQAVDVLTRIRFCFQNGELDFKNKVKPSSAKELMPWFSLLNETWNEYTIFFGHWAALNGKTDRPNIIALDTGCVWGGKLTAYCWETQQKISVEVRDDVKKHQF